MSKYLRNTCARTAVACSGCARPARSTAIRAGKLLGTRFATLRVVMAKNKGMVQLGGTTYRIVLRAGVHEIIRLRDDAKIGCFLHEPVLKVVESTTTPQLVLGIAVCALRSAVVQRKCAAQVERRRRTHSERAWFGTWRVVTASSGRFSSWLVSS